MHGDTPWRPRCAIARPRTTEHSVQNVHPSVSVIADIVFQRARGRRAVVVRVIQADGNVEVAPQFAPHGDVQVEEKSTRLAEAETKLIGNVEIRLRIFVEEQRVIRRGERQAVRARRLIDWHLSNENRPPQYRQLLALALQNSIAGSAAGRHADGNAKIPIALGIGQPPGKHAPGPEAIVVVPQEVSRAIWLPLDRGQHCVERRGGLEGGASLGDLRVDRRLGDLTTTGIAEPGVNPAGEIPDQASRHRPNHDDRGEIDRRRSGAAAYLQPCPGTGDEIEP